ncbi:hypothetical protein ACRXCV_15660 [Halobacteriovorax sp. GFR7]|uniref:hypothetical protein n=1 Tax=unclassified Halobacteriovorax TaxID=2639665 RepID=UPI003D99D621
MPFSGFFQRFKHPVIGVYTSFFIIFNYPLVIFLLSLNSANDKISFVNEYILASKLNLKWPILFTFGYLVIVFSLDLFLAWFDSFKTQVVFFLKDHGGSIGKRKTLKEKLSEKSEKNRELKKTILVSKDMLSALDDMLFLYENEDRTRSSQAGQAVKQNVSQLTGNMRKSISKLRAPAKVLKNRIESSNLEEI